MKKKNFIFYTTFFIVATGVYLWYVFNDRENMVSNPKALSYIQPFAFFDQDSNIITEESIKDKVVVVNYFFTTCRGICPIMNQNMKEIVDKYKNRPDIMFLSHTVQPEIDSVIVLKEYSKLYSDSINNWKFLTGDKIALYNMARTVYKIDDPNNNVGEIDDQFLHTQFFSILNKQGYVKGVYDGLKQKDLKTLNKDIEIYLSF